MSGGRGGFLRAWAPPLAWCAILFVLSSLPIRTDDERLQGADKGAHLAEYAILGALIARALLLGSPARRMRAFALGAALAAVYGLTDEAHQLLVPERAFEWADLAADAAGGILGSAGLVLVAGRRGATSPGTSGSPSPGPSGPPGP